MQRSAPRAHDGAPWHEEYRGSERTMDMSLSDGEWRLLRVARPNILVIGAAADVASTVSTIVARLPGPVSYLPPDAPPPAVIDDAEMLVMPDVAGLSPDRQHEWISWLSSPDERRPQIVATSGVPVYPLVKADQFSVALYYRLNTILLEMQGAGTVRL
jgi:Sigma-54 interaction domain